MRKRRWALLGANLLLATAILAKPGEAAPACYWGDCLCECLDAWAECVLGGHGDGDGPWGCGIELNFCVQDTCVPD